MDTILSRRVSKNLGGQIRIASINAIDLKDNSVLLKSNDEDYEASYVVIAAGAWSKTLALNQ